MQYADESYIISQCQSNIRSAQRTIYDRYAPIFFTICRRYARDEQESEHLLQDGFLKIFQNISRYEGKGSFEGWMKRILVNTCLDYLKSKQIKNEKLTIYPEMLHEQYDVIEWNEVVGKINMEPLLNIIQQLPPMTRLVFNLFIFEGYTHKEIAAIMEISEGTSQWHVNSARSVLKLKVTKLLTPVKKKHEESRFG